MKDGTAGLLVEPQTVKSGGVMTRIASGLVALPPVLAAIHFGAPFFTVFIVAGSLILWWEWCHLCGQSVRAPASLTAAGFVLAALATAAAGRPGAALAVATAGGVAAWAFARSSGWCSGATNRIFIECGVFLQAFWKIAASNQPEAKHSPALEGCPQRSGGAVAAVTS